MISVIALAAFSIGATFNLFDRAHDWLERSSPIAAANVLAVLMILAAVFAVFAARTLQRAEREGSLRAETERRYRTIVERVPAVVYTWDSADRTGQDPVLYISPQIERLLGYTDEEWVADPTLWDRRVHPEDRDRAVATWADAATHGGPFAAEYRLRAADERWVWIRDEAVAVGTGTRGRAIYQGVMLDITEHKRAERRYRQLVEELPVVTYLAEVADDHGDHVLAYISPGIEQLTGRSAQRWMERPQTWIELVHPDDREQVRQLDLATETSGERFEVEYRFLRDDDQVVWVRDSAVLVERDDGSPAWQGVIEDITARRQAEVRLREAEERFRALVEKIPALTYIEDDATGQLMYVSPQVESLMGFTAEEWMSSSDLWLERLHPEDRDRVEASNRKVGSDQWVEDYRTVAKDGRIVWLHNDAVLIRDEDGRPRFWLGVVVDMTERMEAEGRLRAAEGRYRHLVERLPSTVYLDAADDVVTAVYISPQYERLTGYTAEERLADPELWSRILHPDDRERVLAESDRTNASGEPFDVEYRLITKDGGTVWVHDLADLVEGVDSKPCWQGVLTDITERKVAQAALSRRDLILEAVGHAAERFLRATSWTDAIDEILGQLGRAGGASRAAVYRQEPDELGRPCVAFVGEWTAPGIEPLAGVIGDRRIAFADIGLARWVDAFVVGETINARTPDLPEAERAPLERAGVRAIVAVPIFAGGEWWGHLVYDQADEDRVWQQAELDALRIVADTLGAAIGREQAARRLSETEARYQSLIEQIPAITYMESADEPGHKLYISPQVETILGFNKTDWTHEGWLEAVHPDDRDRVLAEDVRTERTGEPFSCEYRLVRPDGRTVWVQDSAVLLRDDRGKPLYWQGVRFDITDRMQAEELLRGAERRYRTLVEQIPAITYVDECRGAGDSRSWPTVYISPQVETILGYSPEEWRTQPDLWLSLIHPDDLERALAADRVHYDTGQPLALEMRLIAKDGSIHWLRDEATIVHDDAGTPLWSQGILLDITERKLSEQQLHEAEARYRSLIETIPAATYIDTVDAISQAIYMSPQVEHIFGYSPQEWIADPGLWERGVDPEDLPAVTAEIRRLNDEGIPFEAEYRFRRPDGQIVWVHDQAVLIRDETGAPRFSQGVMFDITERREAEEQLRSTEERFRAIVEHVPTAVYLDAPDVSMQTMYVSPQIETITGISPQEWTADPNAWADALHPEDHDDILGRYLASVGAQEPWSAEYRFLTRDGRTIWVHDETTVIRDEEGHEAMLLGVLTDVTERKLAEQALRESEQREREAAERLRALDDMKNTFLAAVSHELRSPLTSILGLSLTLERSEMLEDDRNDLLERLAANARKLDRLLKDLLDIDRLNRGIVEPQYRVTDVGALARRTIESLDALNDRSILVEADPVVISVDPAKVERIVENLLTNAARHTTTDRRIWLKVRELEGGVLIAVEDDGSGVPQELREAIFEPFRQGPTASPHTPGTGIGLSLVGRFSELHGGRAWVEEREGGGASFRVFLPGGPVEDLSSLGGNGHHASTAGGGRSVDQVEAG